MNLKYLKLVPNKLKNPKKGPIIYTNGTPKKVQYCMDRRDQMIWQIGEKRL